MSKDLNVTKSVTLGATGSGTVRIGPNDFPGTKSWHVTGVIIQTNRPGVAPIPRIQVFIDSTDPSGILGQAYDGSFNQGGVDKTVNAGQYIYAVWTGGQSGDVASITLTGERA